jgi:prepilin-type processing-associated H-X9-DG protein
MDENPYDAPQANVGGSAQRKKSWISTVLKVLVALGIIALVIMLLLPAVRFSREPARRNSCRNNLKQIALGLRAYEQVYHALPPAYTVDAEGNRLHSWRTLILPYIEEKRLYESIDLTRPWDDPANAKALKAGVSTYHCPSEPDRGNRTTYLAVVTPSSCFRATEPRTLSEVTDGTRETLMVIEVDSEHAVPWMAPLDADEQVVMGIGPNSNLAHPGGFQTAFADGSAHFLSTETTAAQRHALISIAGGDTAAVDDAE